MTHPLRFLACGSVACFLGTASIAFGQAFNPPPGGWTYIYTGEQASPGPGFTALDGTWSHDNGSDSWDESTIGSGSPGGVTGGLTDGSTTYVRMQDTGDPRNFAMPDPSNRKMYFGHDITAEGASDTILDDGVTISFRARIATGPPLDELHVSGAPEPWPAAGDGYAIHDSGKGNFSIRQSSGGVISFALANETDGAPGPVLRMNNLGATTPTAPSGDVDLNEGAATNELSLASATTWNEFWINISAGGTGTHLVQIYKNGEGIPSMFNVTSGTGNDFGTLSYIAMGLGATPQTGAIDIDFFGWKAGIFAPGNLVAAGDFNQDGMVDEADFIILSNNLAGHLDGPVGFEHGDINFDGRVDLDDFAEFKAVFPMTVALAQAQGVPEPSTIVLLACVLTALSLGYRRAARRSAA